MQLDDSSSDRESFGQFASFCVLAVILIIVTGVFVRLNGAEMPAPRFESAMPAPKFAPAPPAPPVISRLTPPVRATPEVVAVAPKGLAPGFRTTEITPVRSAVAVPTLSPVTFRAVTGTPAPRVIRGGIEGCSSGG